MIDFGLHIGETALNKLFHRTHNVLVGGITSQPASRICGVLLITNHES